MKRMWCIQNIDAEYRERMYNILDLYEMQYDPDEPLICLDEKPKQLLWDKRKPIPMKPGKPEKYDYEYVRNGTANVFVAVEFKAGKRITQVTKRRTKIDFAHFVKEVIDNYSEAKIIRFVMDNLNTHKEKSLEEAFGKEEANRILQNVEFHYTPKHASWLNAAEIEINVMDMECTGRRIGDMELLAQQISAWTKRRNKYKNKINWKFTRKIADDKMSKYYAP